MRRGLITVALAVTAAMIVAFPASAAKSSITLVMPSAAVNGGSTGPQYGTQVTFAVSTTTAYPWVDTQCSQNGQVVYEQWAGFFASYGGSQMFTLGPTQLWSGGAATCTATLVSYDKNGRQSTLASTNFNVAG
jgi:hypothetical protein